MAFDATPINMTELLVTVLAIVGIIMLMRKRYDSNMPLLFYFVALLFTNMADRPVNPYLMYGSLAFALLLRFEFMNTGFSKFIAFFTGTGLFGMIWAMMSDAFST
jgi:hypothetical protein